jgi:hypothetical protein
MRQIKPKRKVGVAMGPLFWFGRARWFFLPRDGAIFLAARWGHFSEKFGGGGGGGGWRRRRCRRHHAREFSLFQPQFFSFLNVAAKMVVF